MTSMPLFTLALGGAHLGNGSHAGVPAAPDGGRDMVMPLSNELGLGIVARNALAYRSSDEAGRSYGRQGSTPWRHVRNG